MSSPDFLEIFESVLQKLEDAGIDYMVVGSVASILYGEPRMTRDMDLVVSLSSGASLKLRKAFSELDYYIPPDEVISNEMARLGQFNLVHMKSGLKIDMILRKTSPHALEEFKRRRRISFTPRLSAFVASPEDIIIKKLAYYREGGSEKHLVDIRGIVGQNRLDDVYLQKWISELRLEKEWQKI